MVFKKNAPAYLVAGLERVSSRSAYIICENWNNFLDIKISYLMCSVNLFISCFCRWSIFLEVSYMKNKSRQMA